MEIIVKEENKLKISWSAFAHKYSRGNYADACPRHNFHDVENVKKMKEDALQRWNRGERPVPDVIRLIVGFDNDRASLSLRDKIIQNLKDSNDDDIQVNSGKVHFYGARKEKIPATPKYEGEIEEILEKIEDHVNRLRDLGYYSEIYHREIKSWEWEKSERIEKIEDLKIYMDKNTKIYKFLSEKGLLVKYYSEYYGKKEFL